jgi:predicted phosphodiesterase
MSDNLEWQSLAVALNGKLSGAKIAEIVGKGKTTVNDFLRGYNEMKSMARIEEMYPEPALRRSNEEGKDNSRVLIISDMHIPYHHPNMIPFLQTLKDRYNPTRVISIGDELDKHAMSFHDSDPDLPSAGDELQRSLPVIKQVEHMFPEMDILDSNHGSLVYRKAKHHGIPRHYIRKYNDVLEVGDGWKWHMELTIELPDGQKVYFTHGKSADGMKLSQAMGMSVVQGHFHEKFSTEYWANPLGTYFSMQVGCLIHDDSYAFSYNNTNVKRPMIGCGLIIDGVPVLELMPL